MKNVTYLLALIGLIAISSCGSSGSKVKEKAEDEQTKNTVELTECDEFLAKYEEWIDECLKVVSDYFNNPTDEILTVRYLEVLQEAARWSTKWVSLVDCADDERYEQKFEKISKDLEKKLHDLGL